MYSYKLSSLFQAYGHLGAESGKHALWTGAPCRGLLFAYGQELQLVIFRVPLQVPVQCCSEAGVGALNSVCPSQGLPGEGGGAPPPPWYRQGFRTSKSGTIQDLL